MKKLLIFSQSISAVALAGLGILCFVMQDFILGRPPQFANTHLLNPALGFLSGAIIILCCLAMMMRWRGDVAALIIAGLIVGLTLSRQVPVFTTDWLNALKSLAMVGGLLIVAASFGTRKSSVLIFVGTVLLAIFFMACAYAHVQFFDFVKGFIPAYIPFHGFFAYFTALCLFCGGIGILNPPTRRLAAMLSGVMLLGWFLMLHIPRFINNIHDASDQMGLFESLAFAGFFFVLASVSSHPKKG